MPLVSVILTSYNQSQYLAEAVESVLGQTFQDYELIIVDNGSTDKSHEILSQYEGHPKVRLFLHQENRSVSKRFNDALAVARGEYISFLYSDDYYLPEKLARQVTCFQELSTDYGVVYGPGYGLNMLNGEQWKFTVLNSSGYILKDLFLKYEMGQLNMISPLTRRRCFEQYPFHEDVFAETEAIFFRIALSHKFFFLDEPLTVSRDHLNNAGKAIECNAELIFETLKKLKELPEFPVEYLPYMSQYKATLLRNYGWQAVRVGGDMKWARECFAGAVKEVWQEAFHPRTICGFGLSFLPASIRGKLNKMGGAILRRPSNDVYVEDYRGAVNKA
jgi:glycosyltransferase involved in cell wall biosynthesis